MTDQPQVDNLKVPDNMKLPPKENNFSPLESKIPGIESASTPLDLHNMSKKEEDENKKLIEALMQNVQNEKPAAPSPPTETKSKPEPKIQPKKDISQQQGALMPFVNGFNGLINGIWSAFRSLIPMKR